MPVTVKRLRRTSFLSIDSAPSVGGAAPFKRAKVNDHQTTGKAKVAVTQSATSRSVTSHLPTGLHSSADLNRASRVGDKIRHRLVTNVNVSATSVPPATSTTTTYTTARVSLQTPLTSAPLLVRAPPPAHPLSAPFASVTTLSSLLPEDVHDLSPASVSTDPPSDDNDGFILLVTKGKKSRSRKMTETSGNTTHRSP